MWDPYVHVPFEPLSFGAQNFSSGEVSIVEAVRGRGGKGFIHTAAASQLGDSGAESCREILVIESENPPLHTPSHAPPSPK